MTPPPAIVLLSGGLDSATTLAIARHQGFDCHALSFDYGQRHDAELHAAAAVARAFGVTDHRIARIDLRIFGGSALTDDLDVPKDRAPEDVADEIPVTYVPARNTIFLAFALGFAETIDAADIFIGVNAIDYSGYPDCRPDFIDAFQTTARLATRAGAEGHPLRIQAPLIKMTKAEIIRTGLDLGVDYQLTHSCYDPHPDGRPCQRCDACHLRADGFAAVGIPDPAL